MGGRLALPGSLPAASAGVGEPRSSVVEFLSAGPWAGDPRMANYLIAAALAAAASIAAASPATAALPDADPAIWVVNDADTVIYLFGTFHALDGKSAWFNDEVETAFARSDELVLETIIPDLGASSSTNPVAIPSPRRVPLGVAPSASFLASTRMAI